MAVNQKAVKIISKLLESGFATEQAIAAMTMDDILKLPGIKLEDIRCINELQKSIRDHKIISFLGEPGGKKVSFPSE